MHTILMAILLENLVAPNFPSPTNAGKYYDIYY